MNGVAMRPADRGDEDDRAPALADQRQERLGDGDLADQVHLDRVAEVVDRDELDRAAAADAGVVDEPDQPVLADRALDLRLAVAIERSLVTSIVIGVSRSEPSFFRMLASFCLRTPAKTR